MYTIVSRDYNDNNNTNSNDNSNASLNFHSLNLLYDTDTLVGFALFIHLFQVLFIHLKLVHNI